MRFVEKAFWACWVLVALFVVGRVAHAIVYPDTSATNGAASSTKFAHAIYVAPAASAPGIPTKLTLAGSASVGTTLASAGLCVRISCTVDCEYRVTSGGGTAVVDDNQLPAATPERFCMDAAHDTVTFFSASAGVAYVAVAEP